MTRDRREGAITPKQALKSLPKIAFDPAEARDEQELKRADLLQSILAITELDHITESELVRRVVRNALGHVPEPGD